MCFVDWEKARTDFEACALFWRPLSLQCDEFSLPVDTCKLYLHSSFHVLVRIGQVCVVWCGLLWSSVVGSSLARSGLVWCALVLSGLVWFGLVWSDPDSALVWVWSGSGLVRSGPSGPVRAGQIWSGLVWSGRVLVLLSLGLVWIWVWVWAWVWIQLCSVWSLARSGLVRSGPV